MKTRTKLHRIDLIQRTRRSLLGGLWLRGHQIGKTAGHEARPRVVRFLSECRSDEAISSTF